MDRRRKHGHQEVHHDVCKRSTHDAQVHESVDIAMHGPDRHRDGACHQHVAGVEQALPPRPPHDHVSRQHTHGRGGRTDARGQQENGDQRRQGPEVDLLLGRDLDRVPFSQDDRGHARRDQRPSPRLSRRESPAGRNDCRQRHAEGGDADQRRPQRCAECAEPRRRQSSGGGHVEVDGHDRTPGSTSGRGDLEPLHGGHHVGVRHPRRDLDMNRDQGPAVAVRGG